MTDGYADVAPLGEARVLPDVFLDRPLTGDKEDMFIHISVRKSDGTWSAPERVSQLPARYPSLSPDGRYLFFCGDDGNIYWADKKILDPFLTGLDTAARLSPPGRG